MKLRLSLYLAAISAVLVAAVPSHTARRPRHGGTLRVEIGAILTSFDPTVAAANPEEANAKAELDALLYDRRGEEGTFVGAAGSGAFGVSEWEAGKRAVLSPMKIIAKAGLLWIPSRFRWGGRRTIACWTWSSTRRTSRRFPRSGRARQRTTVCG